MIAADQATTVPLPLRVVTSSLGEGVIRHPSLDPAASENIRSWCQELGVPIEQTVGIYITYGENHTYTEIVEVSSTLSKEGASTAAGWIKADAIVTKMPVIALVLPVADCNAVTYIDPVKGVVALAHLGWHSSVNDLATRVIEYMVQRQGSNPADILIYNSPSIRAKSYHFTYLDQTPITTWRSEPYAIRQPDGNYAIDLVQYNYDQWIRAGIQPQHIEIADVDSATSDNYPSARMGDGSRFAVIAMICAA